jgi:hypothetical protein
VYLDEILARPLFTPSRRPAPREDARAKPKNAQLRSRLAGIFIGPQGREALFVEADKPRASSLHEGEALEGWTVEKIELGQVTLRAGASSLIVEPARDKQRAAAPPMPNSASAQTVVPVASPQRAPATPPVPGADVTNTGGVPRNAGQ